MSPFVEPVLRVQTDEAMPAVKHAPCWYAVYTRPRHEKAVVEQCRYRGLETFLPLYTARRQWKQRSAEVELPLFPTYLFVHMAVTERLKVLTIPSAVELVSVGGVPAAIPDEQVEALSTAVANRRIEPYEYIGPGNRIRITKGAFAGLEGVVLRKKDRVHFIVSFDWMCRSVALEIEGSDIERLL